MPAVRNRLTYVDNLRALCLILMILGHTGLTLEEKNLVYSFHMPMFYILSGYLFVAAPARPLYAVWRKARRLLIPYVLYVFLIYLISYVGLGRSGGLAALWSAFTSGGGIGGGGGALWFLPSLFWTYAAAVLLFCLRIPPLAALSAVWMLWWCTFTGDETLPAGIRLSGLFFFLIGYLLRPLVAYAGDSSRCNAARAATLLTTLATGYALLMWMAGYPSMTKFNIAYMADRPAMTLAAIAVCTFLLIAARRRSLPLWCERGCALVSRYALTIIGTHFLPILIFKHYGLYRYFSHTEYIGLLMLTEALWLPLAAFILRRVAPILAK